MKPFEHNEREFAYSPAYQGWLGYKPGTNVMCVHVAPNGQYRAIQDVKGYAIEGYGATPQAAIDSLEARTWTT